MVKNWILKFSPNITFKNPNIKYYFFFFEIDSISFQIVVTKIKTKTGFRNVSSNIKLPALIYLKKNCFKID